MSPSPAPNNARLLVQVVETTWSKASRGAPAATLRNSTPESLPYGGRALRVIDEAVQLHEVLYREPEFSGEHRFRKPLSPERLRQRLDLEFRWTGSELAVSFFGQLAMPERAPRLRALVLAPEQAGRLVHNWRTFQTFSGEWEYWKRVVNIVVTTQAPDCWFLRPPDALFRDTHHLF
mgnify:FL=1